MRMRRALRALGVKEDVSGAKQFAGCLRSLLLAMGLRVIGPPRLKERGASRARRT
jgi:hypothetical protein